MTRTFWIVSLLVALLLGAAAFKISQAVGSNPTSQPANAQSRPAEEIRVAKWLGGDKEAARKIVEADPNYRAELRQLSEDARKQREELARVLKMADSTEGAVKAQLEKVIAAQNSVERRVVDHVLKIRQFIPPEKRTWLLRAMAGRIGGEKGPFPPGQGEPGKGAHSGHGRRPESAASQPGGRRERLRPSSRPAEQAPAEMTPRD